MLDIIERLTHLIVYLSDYRNVIPTKNKILENKILTEISDISECLTRTMELNRHSSLKFAELSLESAKDALTKKGKNHNPSGFMANAIKYITNVLRD